MGIDCETALGMTEKEFEEKNRICLIDAYKNKNRIFIPKSDEELLENINFIKSKLGQEV